MSSRKRKVGKVGIVGAGNIGGVLAHMIMMRLLADVVLLDIDADVVKGKAIDIMSSAPIFDSGVKFSLSNDYAELSDADIVVVTAGIARKPGMSRDDLVDTNFKVIEQVAKKIKDCAKNEPVVIVVTNPLDVMTYAMCKVTGFSSDKVLGMAGELDTSRFKYFLSEELNVSVADIQATVLGCHGDAMVALQSCCAIAGKPISDYIANGDITQKRFNEIVERTKNGGAEIVKYLKSGSAYYAPASSIYAMIEVILNDTNNILPCSTYVKGEYGLPSDIYIGLPIMLNANGRKKIVNMNITKEEQAELVKSAKSVEDMIRKLPL
ncbi:malate dehydrogenase [Anaplasmataceae bacterium AB001_6]|nr:malate dehydrogenase [Anaplasmataceae bacterium AB001_6]